MKLNEKPEVTYVFENYPEFVKPQMLQLRNLIIETATSINNINQLEETLKWCEPSYVTKYGSTIRIDWKEKNPDYYAMYFQCRSKLVPTFKVVYKDRFHFEGNRAIIFKLNDKIPKKELKHCITLALTYHKVKNLPFLGA